MRTSAVSCHCGILSTSAMKLRRRATAMTERAAARLRPNSVSSQSPRVKTSRVARRLKACRRARPPSPMLKSSVDW